MKLVLFTVSQRAFIDVIWWTQFGSQQQSTPGWPLVPLHSGRPAGQSCRRCFLSCLEFTSAKPWQSTPTPGNEPLFLSS